MYFFRVIFKRNSIFDLIRFNKTKKKMVLLYNIFKSNVMEVTHLICIKRIVNQYKMRYENMPQFLGFVSLFSDETWTAVWFTFIML
jgi:hypothetical protein